MYYCIIKSHSYNLYQKKVYTSVCRGQLNEGLFGKTKAYICSECGAAFSMSYVERDTQILLLQKKRG